jgi:hypothetical protein
VVSFAAASRPDQRLIPRTVAAIGFGPGSYLVGAAATWVSIPATFVVYALTPLFYITPPKFHGAMPTDKVG